MIVIQTKKQMASYRQKNANQKIGLVATMGGLHQGHLDLVNQIKNSCDLIVVSIFVNPSQFSQGEDYQKYPRNLDEDIKQLKSLKVDAVFAPSSNEIYPQLKNKNAEESDLIRFDFGYLSTILCAKSRKNFMSGIGLIVSKLFNIIKPNVAIFGQKDYQQFCVIKKLVNDLNFDIKLIMSPTSRDKNNLALSSRNQYLNKNEKQKASEIYKILQSIEKKLKTLSALKACSKKEFEAIEKWAEQKLNHQGFSTDYLSILNYPDLLSADSKSKSVIVLIASYLSGVRLIDNKIIKLGQ